MAHALEKMSQVTFLKLNRRTAITGPPSTFQGTPIMSRVFFVFFVTSLKEMLYQFLVLQESCVLLGVLFAMV